MMKIALCHALGPAAVTATAAVVACADRVHNSDLTLLEDVDGYKKYLSGFSTEAC